MIKRISRLAMCSVLCCVCAGLYGCVDADDLPTEPNQPGITLTTNVSDWRDEVIYQLIVDRFNNGDINNDFNVDTRSMSRYHGGDWQGIIDKLDYLQELGVTTLWISPPVKNVEEDADFASYHGYWTVDFIKHNPHFGDLATLRRLSNELHKRGMKLILDIVTNHVGQVFFYDINMNGKPNDWLAGAGYPDKGSQRTEDTLSELSRVTEYDPDFRASGIRAYTSMGISGQAPIVFFDIPSINRTAPGPKNIDLDGDGKITTPAEIMGFSNPNWYHQKGRTYDYDTQIEYDYNTRSYVYKIKYDAATLKTLKGTGIYDECRPYVGIGDDGNIYNPWKTCTSTNNCCEAKGASSPYTHRFTNFDGSAGDYLDGTPRQYYQNDQTLLGDFPGGLKDVATEREDVRKAMVQVFSYWIDATDCDGFRIDTLKHVEYSFWEYFAPAIRAHAAMRGKTNFLMYGEAFDGNDNLLAAYTLNENSVDSVFLFSQKYAIDQAFKCAPGNTAVALCGNGGANGTASLYGWDDGVRNAGGRHALFSDKPRPGGVIDSQGNGVAPRDLLVNFLDNHDVGRYLYDRPDEKGVQSLQNALSFLLMQRGIPCIYYGTEQGYMGGNDPGNREDMWDRTASIFAQNPNLGYANYNAWDTGNPLFRHIQKLIRIRKAAPVLRRGTVSNVVYTTSTSGDDAGIYAFTKTYEGKNAVIIVNTHETQTSRANVSLPWSGQSTDLLDDTKATVSLSGSIQVPPMTTMILVPANDRAEYGL